MPDTRPLPDTLPDLPRLISQRIHALGWTIAATGERAGIRPQELSSFLNGHLNMRMETVLRILVTIGLAPLKWHPPADQSSWPTFKRPPTPAHQARMKKVETVATEIERALERAGLSQVELSKASGIHTSTINRLLTRRAVPSDQALNTLRKTLATSRADRITQPSARAKG